MLVKKIVCGKSDIASCLGQETLHRLFRILSNKHAEHCALSPVHRFKLLAARPSTAEGFPITLYTFIISFIHILISSDYVAVN